MEAEGRPDHKNTGVLAGEGERSGSGGSTDDVVEKIKDKIRFAEEAGIAGMIPDDSLKPNSLTA